MSETINGFLDDFHVGRRFHGGPTLVSADDIKAFAAAFDPQPFHLDDAAARSSVFRGVVASGWHTTAMTMRMLVEVLPVAGGMIGKGGEIAWPNPTRPGDELRLVVEIVDLKPSRSRPGRGTIVMRMETQNQRGEPVQIATMDVMARSR